MVVAVLEPLSSHIVFLYIASTILVTLLEWVTGFALEKLFHHRWWDYSKMPLNIGGYVCLLFSLIWGVVCVAIVEFVHPLLYGLLTLIPHLLGVIILTVLTGALLADIYVTVSGIRKWNRRLENLDEIAAELHKISDQIGENIFENMMTGIDLREKNHAKVLEFKEISEEKKAELRKLGEERAQELVRQFDMQHKTGKRLLKAFPKLQSNDHDEIVVKLRENIKKKSK